MRGAAVVVEEFGVACVFGLVEAVYMVIVVAMAGERGEIEVVVAAANGLLGGGVFGQFWWFKVAAGGAVLSGLRWRLEKAGVIWLAG